MVAQLAVIRCSILKEFRNENEENCFRFCPYGHKIVNALSARALAVLEALTIQTRVISSRVLREIEGKVQRLSRKGVAPPAAGRSTSHRDPMMI